MQTIKSSNKQLNTQIAFVQDVIMGLSSKQKYLPSKYFYDEEGDRLFQEIMSLDEYYLTRTEYSILEENKQQILATIKLNGNKVNVIELGAGDGYKTKILLKYFLKQEIDFRYQPIDISANALHLLSERMTNELPGIHIEPMVGDYFDVLENLNEESDVPKLILFLGSTIGNFEELEAVRFLRKLRRFVKRKDLLLIGFDLVKDPQVILDAYNDKKGITREFNLNLLRRINRELDANFDEDKFIHYPIFDPNQSAAKSYLMSTEDQEVYIGATGDRFSFYQWEPVFTEISQKFTPEMIRRICVESGFDVFNNFYDDRKYFSDSLLKVSV
jgi:L-histidine Nalpha-methyltransferase